MKYKFIFPFILLALSGCAMVPKIKENKIQDISTIKTQSLENNLVFQRNKWWNIYEDKNLNNLMDVILKNNSDLKIAQLNIEKSIEYISLSKSKEGPTVDLAGNYQRERLNLAQRFPAGGQKIVNLYNLNLKGNYPIDIFGKYSNLNKEAQYKSSATKMSKNLIQLNLSTKVTQLYGYWKYLNYENENLNEKNIILKEMITMEKTNVDIGNSTKENLLNLKNIYIQNQILLEKNKLNLELTKNSIYLLGGNNINEKISKILESTKNSSNILMKNLNIPSSISSDIVINRPDIQYYLFLIDAQKSKLKSLKADFYPQISLTGNFGYTSLKYSTLFDSYSVLGSIGPSLYLPIFRSGAIRTNYKIAGTDLNIFIENYNKTVINAFNNINNELAKTKTSSRNLNLTKDAFKNTTEIFKENTKKHNLGYLSNYMYLNTKFDWLNSALQEKQAYLQNYNEQLGLINAVGGSFQSKINVGGNNGN
ncbi:TolC family protein [Cetobacterium ceti]